MSIFNSFRTMERKRLLMFSGIGAVSVVILIIIIVFATSGSDPPAPKGSDVLKHTPLIDGHNDLPNNLREILKNKINDFSFEKDLTNDTLWGLNHCKYCYTDLARMKKGSVGAQFWVAYVKCNTQYKDSVAQTLEQIDVIRRLVRKYPNDLQLVTTAGGIREAFENKKLGSLIGVEGGHSIDSRFGVLRTFYDLGVRYMTLTHTCNTPWADGSPVTDKPVHNLTDFGQEIVKEMNRLGMMVDLSHVSANVMREAIKASRAPVIFSHSNAFTVYAHHRNVPDDVLDQLKNNGGIVMVNFYPEFLGNSSLKNITIRDVISHINYIAHKIGVDHVGIGADFDGVESTAQGLEDVSKYPVLFDILHSSDKEFWHPKNLEKLAGENLIRVFKQVEEIREKLALEEDTYEEWIPEEALHDIPEKPENLTVCRTKRDVAGLDYPPKITQKP